MAGKRVPRPRAGARLPWSYFIERGIPLRYGRRADLYETIIATPDGWRWGWIGRHEAVWIAREEHPLLGHVEPYDALPRQHYRNGTGAVENWAGRYMAVVARSLEDWLRAQGIPTPGDLLPRPAACAA
jgi:hypothetical protein